MKKVQNRNTRLFPARGIDVLLVLILLFLSQNQEIVGQGIVVNADQAPLNNVLITLVEEYRVQVSFDDRLLSQYTVTLHREFESPEKAIAYLLEPFPLHYEIDNGVFIVFSDKPPPEKKEYRIAGRIIDQRSGESLPYSHLLINTYGTTTDFSGHFASASLESPDFNVLVSHLGYYLLDTTLKAGSDHVLRLIPAVYELKEISVRGNSVERSGQVGEDAGVLRLNHKVAYRLPGNGDDAIFNFLRLQPGIMAAGEQSSEMIIWGGYSGDSKLEFDGFTIFGPRNFNDHISFVNPYMTKEIRVLKGGYPAEYGDRVGGIVEVTGIDGSRTSPTFNLNINNMTVSGMASLPVRKKAAITAAFRHTYYNIYQEDQITSQTGRSGRGNSGVDVTVTPNYRFRDANLKYAGTTGRGDHYFISLYSGDDLFNYDLEEERNRVRILQETIEKSRQVGGTAFYGKKWKNGFLSNFSLSYSDLKRDLFESQDIYLTDRDVRISSIQTRYNSTISETKFNSSHYFNIHEKHNLQAGIGYIYNNNIFLQDFEEVIYPEGFGHAGRINLYVQDEYHPGPGLDLKPGIRLDYPITQGNVFIQPRLQASYKPPGSLKINAAWGIYNQFIAKTSILDELGNYRYFWVISDDNTVPVLRAQHTVVGMVFHHQGLTISVEPFYKSVKGITRILEMSNGDRDIYQGRARIYGTDLLLKQYLGKHEAWISYTLSKTEELFPYFETDRFLPAPQDQRHEIKGALLLDIQPFYFTVNYVYGSGLAYPNTLPLDNSRYPYSRLDASMIYRLKVKAFRLETGVTVLNVFNRENIKYSNLFEVPDGQFSSISIYAEAVPFTPTLYMNLAF